MKPLPFAGLIGLAALGAHAQAPSAFPRAGTESIVVTATRGLQPVASLRDTVVITRDEIESSGALSLGEVLQRRAGVELRATGGPGQPQGIFIRGAGAAQTLVLVDGLRVGSATAGTTSIESIPLDMIERIEVVKGPMSSLYGTDAGGGVIQIFTRAKPVPYLFAAAGYGNHNDMRASTGLSTADDKTTFSISMGARKVEAPSATNARAGFSYDPDRDPHENAFATLKASHRYWQGETLSLEAFGSRTRTSFDAGIPPAGVDDRNSQTIAGVRFTSSNSFTSWWASRLVAGFGVDKLAFKGQFPAIFETRQDQGSWINEFSTEGGTAILGLETVRQTLQPDRTFDPSTGTETVLFTQNRRNTNSGFVSLNEDIQGQRLEASARRDEDRQFGKRTTGSVSYGVEWPGFARLAGTYARGFRAPTFNDLYGPAFPGFYTPNPDLKPERSVSREISLRSLAAAGTQWSFTAFDNRLEDLIVFSPAQATVLNVASARIRGLEAMIDASWMGTRFRANLTIQRPKDEDTGKRLQNRAGRFGTLEATRAFGKFTLGVSMFASAERFDSTTEASASRLGGYAIFDARLRYAIDKNWTADLTATNLFDRRYESALGYDAPRRGVFLNLRFESY